MGKTTIGALFATAVVITVVATDLLFFKHHSGQRLIVNIGIVLVFVAFYWRLVKRA